MPGAEEQVFIKVDGRQLDFAAAQLIRVTLDQALLLPDAFDIILAGGLEWLKDGTFDIGREVKLELAQGVGTRKTLITGEVTGLMPSMTGSNEVQLQVRGYDRAHRLFRGRHTRSFVQVTDSDIAQRIAQELGFGSNVRATNEVHEYVLQHHQTNLEFLQQRAAAIGYQVGVNEGTLYFIPVGDPPDGFGGQPIDLAWGENLEEFDVSRTTPGQATDVTVRGWDPKRKEAIVGQSQRSDFGPELDDRDTGGEVVKNVFSMEAPMTVFREDVATQAAAEQLAQAILDELQSGFTTAEGSATGDPGLRPGSEVNVSGVGAFAGTYRISSARHTFDQLGYRTSFRVEGSRLPQSALGLTDTGCSDLSGGLNRRLAFGLVTNTEDPLDMGRIKVKLPSLSADLESGWCRLLSPSAGNDRGLFFLPEIGDEVLVTFVGDTPVVLGSLWNGMDVPPLPVAEAAKGGAVNRRVIQSRSGHMLLFDDTTGAEKIVVQDKAGNQIVIESASNKLTIRSQGNIELVAGGNLKIKADGGIDIEASATLNLKGATINLN
jgi:phage protein D/phage baseplate assembly protein gpV